MTNASLRWPASEQREGTKSREVCGGGAAQQFGRFLSETDFSEPRLLNRIYEYATH